MFGATLELTPAESDRFIAYAGATFCLMIGPLELWGKVNDRGMLEPLIGIKSSSRNPADAVISISVTALMNRVATKTPWTPGDFQIAGDHLLAGLLLDVLRRLMRQPQDLLALLPASAQLGGASGVAGLALQRLGGSAAAVFSVLHRQSAWLGGRLAQQVTDYASIEAQLVPTADQHQAWVASMYQLRSELDRVERRVGRLEGFFDDEHAADRGEQG